MGLENGSDKEWVFHWKKADTQMLEIHSRTLTRVAAPAIEPYLGHAYEIGKEKRWQNSRPSTLEQSESPGFEED